MYIHYIFDIDGTLIDTERTGVLSLIKTVRELLGQDVLVHLKESGKWIGYVTSRNRYEFSKDMHLQKMAHLFDAAICAEDTAKHKPDPDPVLGC